MDTNGLIAMSNDDENNYPVILVDKSSRANIYLSRADLNSILNHYRPIKDEVLSVQLEVIQETYQEGYMRGFKDGWNERS